MGDYAPPPELASSTCTTRAGEVEAHVDTDVPLAYDQVLDADVCLDVELPDTKSTLASPTRSTSPVGLDANPAVGD